MPQSALVSAPPSLVDLEATFLPVAQMRQISRITRCEAGSITGELDLGPEHWVFAQHFPGDPIFPGTLMIEAAGQLVALWAWAQGQRGRPRLVKASAEFHSPVGPLHPLLVLQADVRRKRHLHFATIRIWAAEVQVATVEAVLAVLPAAAES
ncbi:MAG: 3-hydroxyacyl-ACP dehydratase FabZ family protein [Gemmatimonadales bacterium]